MNRLVVMLSKNVLEYELNIEIYKRIVDAVVECLRERDFPALIRGAVRFTGKL